MKLPIFIVAALLLPNGVISQDLSGKWYGKITQGPGGYASEYALELEINQRNQKLSGVSFAYFEEDVVARFNYYGFFEGTNRIVLQEGLVLEKKTPPQWVVCIKRMALTYRMADSVEFLEGEWAGVGITDGEACVPGRVYLSKTPHLPELLPAAQISETREVTESAAPPPDVPGMTTPSLNEDAPAAEGPMPEKPAAAAPPGGRSLKEGKEIEVRNPEIIVKIIDYQILDGDTVTVYFNDLKIVDRQLISKEPIVLHLRVDQAHQPAKLLLHADNLGRIPPNTALMIVEDREGRQRIKLESDYQRSDVLFIRYRK